MASTDKTPIDIPSIIARAAAATRPKPTGTITDALIIPTYVLRCYECGDAITGPPAYDHAECLEPDDGLRVVLEFDTPYEPNEPK